MSNVRAVYQRLLSHGLLPHQAAAVVGRFQQESGPNLNPTIIGDRSIPGGSVGIGQWNRERQANLKRFAGADWANPLKQVDFFIHEGKGPEARAFSMIKNAKTLEEAVRGAMAYERPVGFTWNNPTAGHGYSNTVRNAQAILGGKLGGDGGSVNTLPGKLGGDSMVARNFDPQVAAQTNTPLLGSLSGFGGSGTPMASGDTGGGGIDPIAAQLAAGQEKKKKGNTWGDFGAAIDASIPRAPGISGGGGGFGNAGNILSTIMQNPQALAQALMKRRMV